MIHLNGNDYAQAGEAAAQLGGDITEALVRGWGHRRLITQYRIGRTTWYRMDELIEVEFVTRTSRGGRHRKFGLTSANA